MLIGEHDYDDVIGFGIGLDFCRQFQTVHPRHHDVAYKQLVILGLDQFQCTGSIFGLINMVGFLEQRLQVLADFGIILGDQDGRMLDPGALNAPVLVSPGGEQDPTQPGVVEEIDPLTMSEPSRPAEEATAQPASASTVPDENG